MILFFNNLYYFYYYQNNTIFVLNFTMLNKKRYLRVFNSLKRVKNDLIQIRSSIDYDLKNVNEYNIDRCCHNFINKFNDKLYLSMSKICHYLQSTSCYFIERGHYESAIDNLWQSYIERRFKNIIYRYGCRFFHKNTNNDSPENHEKHERLVLIMIKYLISYVEDSNNEINIKNLNWVKTTAFELLNKEKDGPEKFKSINQIKKCNNLCSTNNMFKTKLCKHFIETGKCQYGDKCIFAHGKDELRKIENKKIDNNLENLQYFEKFINIFFSKDKSILSF